MVPTPTKDEQKAAEAVTRALPADATEEQWQAALEAVDADSALYEAVHPLIIERLERLDQIPAKLAFLFWGPNVVLDEKSRDKVLLKEGARADEALAICRAVLADEAMAWDAEALQEACRAQGEAAELKPKLLFQPLRVAVCGNMVSPPLFESIVLMDRADVLARIDAVAAEAFGA